MTSLGIHFFLHLFQPNGMQLHARCKGRNRAVVQQKQFTQVAKKQLAFATTYNLIQKCGISYST